MMNFQQIGTFDGAEVRTGPDGTYRTPRELERDSTEFRAMVKAEGLLPAQTSLVTSAEAKGDVLTMPDVVLRRVESRRELTGRVVDRGGQPVAGARVVQSGDGPKRTHATTDADGRFRLEGVYSDVPVVAVAEADGYRTGGAVVPPGGEALVRLDRAGTPPASALKTLPPTMPRADERALARRLLAPVVTEARQGARLGLLAGEVYPTLARVDPEKVLTMIENRVLSGQGQGGLVTQAALGQYEDDPGTAVATVESDLDPAARSAGFLLLADLAAELDGNTSRRDPLLERSLAEGRKVIDRAGRVRLLGEVADRWLDSGKLDRATPLLREGQALLAESKEAWFWESERFAEVLAVIDRPAAQAIFERRGVTNASKPTPNEVSGHLEQVAWRLAPFDPAGAEELIRGLTPNLSSGAGPLLRTCRAMAPVDLPRARRLLDRLPALNNPPGVASPTLRAYALSLMAGSIAARDEAAARGLLDEVIDALTASARDAAVDGFPPASCVLAGLLPLVERLEPDRVGEVLWRAAAARPPRTDPSQLMPFSPEARSLENLAALALLVGRYDRELADAVLSPVLARFGELLAAGDFSNQGPLPIFRAVVALDPRRAAALVDGLPPRSKVPRTHPGGNEAEPSFEAQARVAEAGLLALPVVLRRRAAVGNQWGSWPLAETRRPGIGFVP